MRTALVLSTLAAFASAPAQAMLFDAWSKALVHDADYQIALTEPDIKREDHVQARSQLLPQISAQGSRGKADAKITGTGPGGTTLNRNYDANLWALQIRQPLVRPSAFYAWRSSSKRVAASTAQLQDARQTLLANLIETMAQLQFAEASLTAAKASVLGAQQKLSFTQRQLSAGNVTRRETAEAQTALALAQQQIAEAMLDKSTQEATWTEITGDAQVMLPALPADLVERLPLTESDVSKLLSQAKDKQPAILAAMEERNAAALDVQRARSEHLPTLDLNASRSFSESNTENTIDTTFLTNRVDLQLTLPLFSGGATQARVRQSQARLAQAEARLDGVIAKVQSQIVRALAGLTSARQQAASARATLEAAEVSLRSATLGITAGTATVADKINAEADRAVAERDKVRANVQALLFWSQLQQALGLLDDDRLRALMNALEWKEPPTQAISFGT
ncbi:MAG: TolC family protein [Pseudomonadota bacterium]